MRRPWFYPLVWGLMVAASGGVLWGFSFGLPESGRACASATCVDVPALPPALLTAAGVASFLLGAALLAARTDGVDRGRRPVADQSMASVVLAVAIGLTALGGAVGSWLVWIGCGLMAAGLGGVIREGLAMRELRRRDPGA